MTIYGKIVLIQVLISVLIQGQEPLTESVLAAAPPQEQKQMLGERLFPLIQSMQPELAGKITGMLLEMDNSELIHMLEHNESLNSKVDEAVAVLLAHQSKSIENDENYKDIEEEWNEESTLQEFPTNAVGEIHFINEDEGSIKPSK